MSKRETTETVLVVGATGVIGVSAVIGALRSGRNVLAVVRSKDSAEKMLKHVGTQEGITIVEADVTSENGIQGIVDMVKANRLPVFHHVYSTVATLVSTSPIWKVDTASYRHVLDVNIDSQFFAYRATIPYLIEQGFQLSTWTLMTGAAGDLGTLGVSSMSQGALFALASVACRENASTNIRFNEVNLGFHVQFSDTVMATGVRAMPSSEFACHYEKILARPDINGTRISLLTWGDLENLRFKEKVPQA